MDLVKIITLVFVALELIITCLLAFFTYLQNKKIANLKNKLDKGKHVSDKLFDVKIESFKEVSAYLSNIVKKVNKMYQAPNKHEDVGEEMPDYKDEWFNDAQNYFVEYKTIIDSNIPFISDELGEKLSLISKDINELIAYNFYIGRYGKREWINVLESKGKKNPFDLMKEVLANHKTIIDIIKNDITELDRLYSLN